MIRMMVLIQKKLQLIPKWTMKKTFLISLKFIRIISTILLIGLSLFRCTLRKQIKQGAMVNIGTSRLILVDG